MENTRYNFSRGAKRAIDDTFLLSVKNFNSTWKRGSPISRDLIWIKGALGLTRSNAEQKLSEISLYLWPESKAVKRTRAAEVLRPFLKPTWLGGNVINIAKETPSVPNVVCKYFLQCPGWSSNKENQAKTNHSLAYTAPAYIVHFDTDLQYAGLTVNNKLCLLADYKPT